MKCLKSILALALVLTLALSLAACGNDNTNTPDPTEGATTAPTGEPAPSETAAPTEDGKVTYTVTVEDEAGNPLEGAIVQLCLDNCTPQVTDANGVATYKMDAEADYKVSFVKVPDGYTAEEAYHFADGSYEITITLKAA